MGRLFIMLNKLSAAYGFGLRTRYGNNNQEGSEVRNVTVQSYIIQPYKKYQKTIPSWTNGATRSGEAQRATPCVRCSTYSQWILLGPVKGAYAAALKAQDKMFAVG